MEMQDCAIAHSPALSHELIARNVLGFSEGVFTTRTRIIGTPSESDSLSRRKGFMNYVIYRIESALLWECGYRDTILL